MPSIVYQTDKRSGSTYAYRSTSYRDPETGRPRSRREYLGRVDPATGEIVPKAGKGRRNRTKVGEGADGAEGVGAGELLGALRFRDDELDRLREEVERLRARNAQLEAALAAVTEAISGIAPQQER